MQNLLLFVFAALVASRSAAALDISFDYFNQTAWGDIDGAVCTTGDRQSPIDILTSEEDDATIDLILSMWSEEREGKFENVNGHTVEFLPNADQSNATTTNHQGTYFIQQVHMHWGQNDSVGSEHRINGGQNALEIHFVHRKTDGPDNAGNANTVVAVMAVAGNAAESGSVWNTIPVEDVQEFDEEVVGSLRYADLLPEDLSYYYYEGSLTTPLCSEVVQWFVLKETITVPKPFLEQLRMVERDQQGNPLEFNYRNTQDLNGRSVALHNTSGSSTLKPLFSLLVLSLSAFILVHRL